MVRHFFPGCLNISCYPLSDVHHWLVVVPAGIMQTFWYVGGWNQLTLSSKVSSMLVLAAVVAVAAGAWLNWEWRLDPGSTVRRWALGAMAMVSLGGLGAAYSIALASTQYQGRFMFAGLGGITALVTVGTWGALRRLLGRWDWVAAAIWPMLMACLLGWVMAVYLIPLRGL